METIGLPELVVIGLVFVLLFGTRKIPDLGKGLGEGIRNFKNAIKGPSHETPEQATDFNEQAKEAVVVEETAGKV